MSRALPQSHEAEKGVICSVLLNPSYVLGLCAEARVSPEWFVVPAYRTIYRRLVELNECSEPIDLVSLTQHLRDLCELDEIGGAVAVTELFDYLPTAANAQHYLDILSEKHLRRAAITCCEEVASKCYDESQSTPALIDELETKALAVRGVAKTSQKSKGIRSLVISAVESIEKIHERKGGITGISTGFSDLDRAFDGLNPQELIVIAARPSVGKTAISMNMAEHIAVDLKKPVAVFSLEMSAEQLTQRLISCRARVDMACIRDGYFPPGYAGAISKAANDISNAPLHIEDDSELTIQEIRSRARRLRQQHGIEVFFIDYLQLIRSNTKRAQDNRQQEVSEVSAGLKAMAKELCAPVVVPAQLNRATLERANQGSMRPRLSDLRDSGAIEQDADKIAFLVRPEMLIDNQEELEQVAGQATLYIGKNRNGPLADVPLHFIKENTRFVSVTHHH